VGRYNKWAAKQLRRPIRITNWNKKGFTTSPLEEPELRWMDQLLKSFNEETPQDWLPAQYQAILGLNLDKKPTLH